MLYYTAYHSIPRFAQKSPMEFSIGDNFSKQRRKKAENTLPDPQHPAAVLSGNLPALLHSLLKILLHILHRIAVIQQHIVFKMQI